MPRNDIIEHTHGDGRRPIISANWKMHNNHFEAIQSVQKLSYLVGKDDVAAVDVCIHPPFTDIRSIQTLIEADELHASEANALSRLSYERTI